MHTPQAKLTRERMKEKFEYAAKLQRRWNGWLDRTTNGTFETLAQETGDYVHTTTSTTKSRRSSSHMTSHRPASAQAGGPSSSTTRGQQVPRPQTAMSRTSAAPLHPATCGSLVLDDDSQGGGSGSPIKSPPKGSETPVALSRGRPTTAPLKREHLQQQQSRTLNNDHCLSPSPSRIARNSVAQASAVTASGLLVFLQRIQAQIHAVKKAAARPSDSGLASSARPTSSPVELATAMAALEALVVILGKGVEDDKDGAGSFSAFEAMGALMHDLYNVVRTSVYVDHIPFLADLPQACAVGSGAWFNWVLQRAAQFQDLTTQQQAHLAATPAILRAHTEAYDNAMQERHTKDFSSLHPGRQQVKLSFMERRAKTRLHFRAWRTVTRQAVATRFMMGKAHDSRILNCKANAFLRWRGNVSDQVRHRRSEDVYHAGRALHEEEAERHRAEGAVNTGVVLLNQTHRKMDHLKAEVERLQKELEHYQSPMVFDFREPIYDEMRGKEVREGTIRFKTNTTQSAGVRHQYGLDDQSYFDFIVGTTTEGVSQPRRTPLCSYYHIRVDTPHEKPEPALDWIVTGAMSFCRSKKNLARQWLEGKNTGARGRPYGDQTRTVDDGKGWDSVLLRSYGQFLAQKDEFDLAVEARARNLMHDKKKNVAILLTHLEPKPEFAVSNLSDLSKYPYVYFAAMHHFLPSQLHLSLRNVKHRRSVVSTEDNFSDPKFASSRDSIPGPLSPLVEPQQGPPIDTMNLSTPSDADPLSKSSIASVVLGTTIADAHATLAELGCVQQVPLAELDESAPSETAHRILACRLMSYHYLQTAVDRDQRERGGRAVAAAAAAAASGSPSSGASTSFTISPPDADASTEAPPIAPSGALRSSDTCRSLLSLVAQRSGADFTTDRSALEVLAWVREVLQSAQALVSSTTRAKQQQRERRKSVFGKKKSSTLGRTDEGRTDAVSSGLVNVQNLEEDFGEGLDLLVSIVQHLVPASHVPTVSNMSFASTPSDTSAAADYLLQTATQELKAHVPKIVHQQLHTCTPSIKLLYLTAIYNVMHQQQPADESGGAGGAGGGSPPLMPSHSPRRSSLEQLGLSASMVKSRDQTPAALLAQYGHGLSIHLALCLPLQPYIAAQGPLPPLPLKATRLAALFGRSQAVEAAVGTMVKLWPLVLSTYLRYSMLDPTRGGSTEGIALSFDLTLQLLLDLGFISTLPSTSELKAERLKPVAQIARLYLQAAVFTEEELREDARDLRPWKTVSTSNYTKLMRHASLSPTSFAEFLIRLAAFWDSTGVSANATFQSVAMNKHINPTQSGISAWQQGALDRVQLALKLFLIRCTSVCPHWTNIDTSTSGRGGASPIPASNVAMSPKMTPYHPYRLTDPRYIRAQIFTPDVLRLLKARSGTLVRIYVTHSHFTIHTWKLLDQREMTFAQFMKIISKTRLLDIEEGDDEPLSPKANPTQNFFGFNSFSAATLSEGFVSRLFDVTSFCRRTASLASRNAISAVPVSTKVPPMGTLPNVSLSGLELKMPLAASHSTMQPVLTYGGFCEMLIALARCLLPLPWLQPADCLALLLDRIEAAE